MHTSVCVFSVVCIHPIPTTHAPETGAINRLHLLAPVSGMCVRQIWNRIRLVPDSGPNTYIPSMHVTVMIIYDLPVFLFNLHLVTISGVIIAAPSANSTSSSLSATFIFGTRNFHSKRMWYEKPLPITGARKWSRFMAPVSGARVIGIRY